MKVVLTHPNETLKEQNKGVVGEGKFYLAIKGICENSNCPYACSGQQGRSSVRAKSAHALFGKVENCGVFMLETQHSMQPPTLMIVKPLNATLKSTGKRENGG